MTFSACLLGHEGTHQVKMPLFFSPYIAWCKKKGVKARGECRGGQESRFVYKRREGASQHQSLPSPAVVMKVLVSASCIPACLPSAYWLFTNYLQCCSVGDKTR